MLYTVLVWNLMTAVADVTAVRYLLPYLENTSDEKKTEQSASPFKLFAITGVIVALCSITVPVLMPDMSAFSIFKIGVSFSVLSVTFVTDFLYYRIPNILPIVLIFARAVCLIPEIIVYQSGAWEGLLSSFLVAVGILVLLLLVRLLAKGGLGFGDIKLVSALAFLCGFRAGLFTLLLSSMACAVVSVVLLFRRKKTLKDTLPLGPFLLIGFALTVILGVG